MNDRGGPSDADAESDEPLTNLLAACDEKLAAGDDPLDDPAFEGASAPLPPKLRRGMEFLRKLDKLRPGRADEDGLDERDWRARSARDSSWKHGDPTRIGRFRIKKKLGQGGFGVVYLAYDPRLRRQVALKIPHPRALLTAELRDRFELEAAAAAGLDHRNIVQVYEGGSAGPVHYIAAAYCPGITLAAWLRQRRDPVPARTAARLVAQIAEGVQHAHERGILHRDLKPGNILLTPMRGGRAIEIEDASTVELDELPIEQLDDADDLLPRITDFGMAKRVGEWRSDGAEGERDGAAPLTKTGAVMGTPSHMAPEQAAGRTKDVGPATDVHGLGVILYEILTGQSPFLADSTFDTLRRVQDDEPLPPRKVRPKLPRDLETICLKCLQKEPRRRYASAGELADDLHCFLDGRTIRARSVGPVERAWRWSVREPLVASLLGALALVVVSAIAGLSYLWVDASKSAAAASLAERKAKDQAEVALGERNSAVAARVAAEQFLGQARTLVGELTAVADRMARQPALASTRQELTEKLLVFHENFLAEKPHDPDVLFNSALAYFNAGQARVERGREEDALRGLKRSAELLDELTALKPDVAQILFMRARVYFWTAKFYQVRSKRLDEAERQFEKSVALMRLLLARHPGHLDYLEELALNLVNSAPIQQAKGRFDLAEAQVADALRIGRDVARARPSDPWTRINLAIYLDEHGQLAWTRGRRDAAIRSSEEAIRLMDEAKRLPDPPAVAPMYLARFLNTLAYRRRATGNPDECRRLHLKARDELVPLVALYPDTVDYRELLGETALTIGTEFADAGRFDESFDSYRIAKENFAHLAAAAPSDVHRTRLAVAHLRTARLLLTRRPREALAEYDAAVALRPNDAALLNEFAWSLLTGPDLKSRDPARGLALAQKALDARPDEATFLNTLGVARYRNGEFAAARELFERSKRRRNRISPFDEIFLAMTLQRMGETANARAAYNRFLLFSVVDLARRRKPLPDELSRFQAEAEALLASKP